MSSQAILPDTSLCTIVRDEMQNPAGGIRRFIDSHVPYVEEAVVVDTGSIDGTREVLEELQYKYPNLRIFDRKFKGYADARNHSLKHVDTKYALILDADELLTHKKPQNDFQILGDFMGRCKAGSYYFMFHNLFFPGDVGILIPYHGSRLFDFSKRRKYENEVWETLEDNKDEVNVEGIKIKHFLPPSEGIALKGSNWYSSFDCLGVLSSRSPSQTDGFQQWKAYNPRRDDFE